MRLQDVHHLFAYGESDWLDYKADLGPGIERPDMPKDQRAHDQGKLLKDLMCLANSPAPQLRRYLIRGVKDQASERRVVGVTRSLDDADIQGWVHGKFDPPMRVQYWEWPLKSGGFLGAFEITVTPGVAHVPVVTHGKDLIRGQVWWRAGSENQLPGPAGLRRLFGPPRAHPVIGWEHGGSLTGHLDLQTWVRGLQRQAHADWQVRVRHAAGHLQDVAARPRPSLPPPTGIQVLNRVSPAVSASMDETQVEALLNNLRNWGVEIPRQLLRPKDLWSTRPTIWPSNLTTLMTGVEGAGLDWYEALARLVGVIDDYTNEWNRLQQLGERPQLVIGVQNLGGAALQGGILRLTPVEGVAFKFSAMTRLPLAPRHGEVRPGPGGAAEIMLGDLPPQGRLSIPFPVMQRTLAVKSTLRAEVRGVNLPEAVAATLLLK